MVSFTYRVLVVLGVLVVALFLWKIANVLLLAFAGVLLAVVLHGVASRVTKHTPLSTRWGLPVAGLLILGVLALVGWLIGPNVAAQMQQLSQQVPQMIDQIRQYAWGDYLLQQVPQSDARLIEMITSQSEVFKRVTGVLSTVLNVLGTIVLILFVGIYLSVKPGWYRDGVAALVPQGRRARVREVFDTAGRALWKWLIGTLISMTIIGTMTTVGLLILGMPMALALGVIVALMEFVPYLGPFLAMVPAVLVGLMQSPTMGLYVALLYLGLQQIESNIVYPLVQQHEVSLPPALTVLAVVTFGVLFGIGGVFLATPLLVVVLVFVKMLYIEDALGDHTVDVPGEQQ